MKMLACRLVEAGEAGFVEEAEQEAEAGDGCRVGVEVDAVDLGEGLAGDLDAGAAGLLLLARFEEAVVGAEQEVA